LSPPSSPKRVVTLCDPRWSGTDAEILLCKGRISFSPPPMCCEAFDPCSREDLSEFRVCSKTAFPSSRSETPASYFFSLWGWRVRSWMLVSGTALSHALPFVCLVTPNSFTPSLFLLNNRVNRFFARLSSPHPPRIFALPVPPSVFPWCLNYRSMFFPPYRDPPSSPDQSLLFPTCFFIRLMIEPSFLPRSAHSFIRVVRSSFRSAKLIKID